jgi:hypothetical protein
MHLNKLKNIRGTTDVYESMAIVHITRATDNHLPNKDSTQPIETSIIQLFFIIYQHQPMQLFLIIYQQHKISTSTIQLFLIIYQY